MRRTKYRIRPALFSRFVLQSRRWYGWAYVTFDDDYTKLMETVRLCNGDLVNPPVAATAPTKSTGQ